MLYRLSPIVASLRSRLSGERDLADVAAKTEVIEEESVSDYPPAIYLPSELEKVTATSAESNMQTELARVRGGSMRHAPLIRYEFEDALVFDTGFTVKNASFARYGRLPIRSLMTTKPRGLDRAHYAGCHAASKYFGHWLRDSCATALLTRDGEALFLPYNPDWKHAREYIDLLRLPEPEDRPARVGRLSYHSDYSQNRNRARRYAELRARLRKSIGNEATANAASRIFLLRSSGSPRNIANNAAVVDSLTQKGFLVVDPTSLGVADLMRKTLDAEVCVSMEGSHQNHAMMFLQQGGVLINIQPADRFNNIAQDFVPAIGIRYGFVVGERIGDAYKVDVDILLRTIERAERARTTTC